MDIFFSGSIRGGRSDADLYGTLIDVLDRHGTVLTEHVGEEDVEANERAAALSDADIYEQDLAWLRQADVLIAEVTTPSLGVGYELGRADAWGTPILALYRPGANHDLSAMVRGNDAVDVVEYKSVEDAAAEIDSFLEDRS